MMDKKTRNIVIVVAVVVVVGGLFYSIQRYRQQMAVSSYLKGMGLSGVAQQVAQNAINTQTNGDKYTAATEIAPYDDGTRAISDNSKWLIEGVYGKAKAVAYSTVGGQGGYVMYEVPRPTTGADISTFAKLLSDRGYLTITSAVSDNEATLTMNKAGAGVYVVAFSVGDQEVSISYSTESTQ